MSYFSQKGNLSVWNLAQFLNCAFCGRIHQMGYWHACNMLESYFFADIDQHICVFCVQEYFIHVKVYFLAFSVLLVMWFLPTYRNHIFGQSIFGCCGSLLTQISLIHYYPALTGSSLCPARKFLHVCSLFLDSKVQDSQRMVTMMKTFSLLIQCLL